MKKLSKDEMKKVVGGVMAPPPSTICNDGDRVAHCTWQHGACINQAWGYCPAGTEASCDMYCVRPDNSTYNPGNC